MNILRKLDQGLNRLYMLAGILGGLMIVLITIAVVINIISRLFGSYVPGLTEVSGYMMAGAGSMGLAWCLKENGHIRVQMLIELLRGKTRRLFELWALLASTAISGYLSFYLVKMVYVSWLFEERSDGSDEVLLWIPQSITALGFVIFSIALTHSLLSAFYGQSHTCAEVPDDINRNVSEAPR